MLWAVAETFPTSCDTVFRTVEMAATWGRQHWELNGIGAIGIDEVVRN